LKDLIEGELEIGQIAGLIHEVKSAEGIILENSRL
jgi:enoyl-[acyl-carrier protein] reductase II